MDRGAGISSNSVYSWTRQVTEEHVKENTGVGAGTLKLIWTEMKKGSSKLK